MKTFLVPVDFSTPSVNAAKYAVALTSNIDGVNIILYHVYSRISIEALTEKGELTRKLIYDAELNVVKDMLTPSPGQKITIESEEGSFLESIEKYILSNHIDMVIMGITGSSRLKQIFMGTNTLNVIRHVSCPVMIVPPDAEFKGIKNAVFTSDFKDVARTTPFPLLKNVIDLLKAQLYILNVDSEHYIELTDEFKKEKEAMEDKLGVYNPEFSFVRSYDFVDGINTFVELRDIDTIITLPRKHSFLTQLFKVTHTKKLAYHSRIPTIAIPA